MPTLAILYTVEEREGGGIAILFTKSQKVGPQSTKGVGT